jgi:hypothetical protein
MNALVVRETRHPPWNVREARTLGRLAMMTSDDLQPAETGLSGSRFAYSGNVHPTCAVLS